MAKISVIDDFVMENIKSKKDKKAYESKANIHKIIFMGNLIFKE